MDKPWQVIITSPEHYQPPEGYTVWWDDAYFWMKGEERSPDYPDLISTINTAVIHALLHHGK